MNDFTSVITLSTPDYIKECLKHVLDDLEQHGYAFIDNSPSARLLSRLTLELRQTGVLILTTPCSVERVFVKNVVSIPYGHEFVRGGDYKFKIKHPTG